MVFLLLTFYKLGWLMLFMRQVLVFWLAVFLVLITFFLNNSGVGNLVCMPIRRYPLWSTWQFDETHNHAIKFYPNQNIPNRLRMCSRMTELCSCKAKYNLLTKVKIVWEHSDYCFSCATRPVLVRWTSSPYLLLVRWTSTLFVHHGRGVAQVAAALL